MSSFLSKLAMKVQLILEVNEKGCTVREPYLSTVDIFSYLELEIIFHLKSFNFITLIARLM